MGEKRVVIGSDKSGFRLKEAVKSHLTELGYEVADEGTRKEEEPKPYFQVAPVIAKKIQSGEFERGILICGTGMGMAVVANKYKGCLLYTSLRLHPEYRRSENDGSRADG